MKAQDTKVAVVEPKLTVSRPLEEVAKLVAERPSTLEGKVKPEDLSAFIVDRLTKAQTGLRDATHGAFLAIQSGQEYRDKVAVHLLGRYSAVTLKNVWSAANGFSVFKDAGIDPWRLDDPYNTIRENRLIVKDKAHSAHEVVVTALKGGAGRVELGKLKFNANANAKRNTPSGKKKEEEGDISGDLKVADKIAALKVLIMKKLDELAAIEESKKFRDFFNITLVHQYSGK